MLTVLLTILKILGFIILGIIALVLLIVLAVLFAPIRYRATGDVAMPDIDAVASAGWLLHIVHVSLTYRDGEGVLRIRVFGIPIKKKAVIVPKESDEPKDERSISDKVLDTIRSKIRDEDGDGTDDGAVPGDEATHREDPGRNEEDGFVDENDDDDDGDGSGEKDSARSRWQYSEHLKEPAGRRRVTDVDPPRRSLFQKIGDFFRRIGVRIRNLFETVKDAIRGVNEKKEKVLGYVRDPQYKEAAMQVLHELIRLLRHYRPRRLRGFLELGLDDPSATGMIVGVYYAVYPVDMKHFRLTGCFTEKKIEGSLRLRGHIRLIHAGLAFLRLYRNKTIKDLLSHKEDHNGRK